MLSALLNILANLFCAFCLFWLACKEYPKWKTLPHREAIIGHDFNMIGCLIIAAAFLCNALAILIL